MNRARLALSRSAFLLAPLYLALTACGGSSATSSNERFNANPDQEQTTTDAETVERVSLTGLAVKGLVHGAKAELFRIVNGAVESNPYATGATDQEGRYDLTIVSKESYDGPALIRISWQPDAEITCDAQSGCGDYPSQDNRDTNTSGTVDFGERFDLEDDFQMAAIIPRLATRTDTDHIVTAHVSSLTNASAALAQSDLISEASIDAANNQIRAVLGLEDDIDILLTPPVDVTGSNPLPGSAEYGAVTAALAEIAQSRGISLSEILSGLATEFENNQGQLLWNSKGSLTEISIAEVAEAALIIAQTSGNTELANKFQQLITVANSKAPDMLSDVEPPIANAGSDQIVGTKTNVTLVGSNGAAGASTYQWQQVSGTAVALSNANAQQTTFASGTLDGDLVFRLTVTNQETGYSDIDYVTITITPTLAGREALATLNGTHYTLWNPAVYITSGIENSEPTNILGYKLEVERSFSLTTTADTHFPLSLNTSGDIRAWEMSNEYRPNQFFTGQLARSNSQSQLVGVSEIGAIRSLPTNLNDLNSLTVQLPSTPDQDGELEGVSLSSNVHLMPLGEGSWFGAHIDQTDFFSPDDKDQSTKTPIKVDYFVNTPLLVQDSNDFTADKLATQYGVISMVVGSDTSLSHVISTELEYWQISSEYAPVITAMTRSLSDDESLGNVGMRYSHQLNIDDGVFTVSPTPYSVSVYTETPDQENLEVYFTLRKNGQIRVPSSLIDGVSANDHAAVEGIASADGQLLMIKLMADISLGNFSGANIHSIAHERYVALATAANALNSEALIDAQYEIKGLLFEVNASSRGMSTIAISGSLQLNNSTATLSLNGDAARLQNAGFTAGRSQPTIFETTDGLELILEDHGYVRFQIGELTLEGFASADGNTLALRAMDNNLFEDSVRHATQGFLIARKVD